MNELREEEMLEKLVGLLGDQQKSAENSDRNVKLQKVLLLLAGGAALATALALPGTARLFSFFQTDQSDWKEWKQFNKKYLRQVIARLHHQKMVEIVDNGSYGEVKLTENGRQKIMRMGLESLKITKPGKWDGKWRIVFYDVFDGRKKVREKFRQYLKGAGFYPLQKSVYLHAYPCEREIEFLKYFLGIAGEVRIVIADKIENDKEFRDFFGV